jgi:hypothetical protein
MSNTPSLSLKTAEKFSPPNTSPSITFIVFFDLFDIEEKKGVFLIKLDYLRSHLKGITPIYLISPKKEVITAKEIIFFEKTTSFFSHLFVFPQKEKETEIYKQVLEKTHTDWLFVIHPESFAMQENEFFLILKQLQKEVDLLLFEREKVKKPLSLFPLSLLFWSKGLFLKDFHNPNYIIHRGLLHYFLNLKEKNSDFFIENLILKSNAHGARIKIFPLKQTNFIKGQKASSFNFLDAFRFVCKNLGTKRAS